MKAKMFREQTDELVKLFKTYDRIRFRQGETGFPTAFSGKEDRLSRLDETNRLLTDLTSRQVRLFRLRETWSDAEREPLNEVINLIDQLKKAVSSIHMCQWQLFQIEQQEKLSGHKPDLRKKRLIRENQGRVLQGCWSTPEPFVA